MRNLPLFFTIASFTVASFCSQAMDAQPKEEDALPPRLVFHAGGDTLSVLRTRDPAKAAAADNPDIFPSLESKTVAIVSDHFRLICDTYPEYFADAKTDAEKRAIYKECLRQSFFSTLKTDVYDLAAFNQEPNPEVKECQVERNRDYLNYKHRTVFDTVICPLQMQDRFIIQDLAIGAQWIDDTVTTHGRGPVLFYGRSPAYVEIAYRELLKHKYKDGEKELAAKCKSISFSGNPDADSFRISPDHDDSNINFNRNVITEQRLKFFMDYLGEEGLGEVKDKLYLADIHSTLVSLNSMLRILRYYYIVHLGRQEMPDMHYIGLSLQRLAYDKLLRPNFGEDNPIFKWDPFQSTITFGDHRDSGIWPLTIPATAVDLAGTTSSCFMDADNFQLLQNPRIYFPAYKWNPLFRDKLKQSTPFWPDAHALLIEGLGIVTPEYENALRIAREQNLLDIVFYHNW